MGKILMISDTHLFQKNIRIFSGLNSSETDKQIITSLRKNLGEDDILFHLGDVGISYGGLTDVFQDLPGIKILIMGNHDTIYTPDEWKEIGFNEVYRFPIIYEEFYILSHEPQYITQYMPYVNIHGHTHGNIMCTPGAVNQYINVSCDNLRNYQPRNFAEIKSQFK